MNIQIVGWALIHSLWQGALIAGLYWGLLRVFRRTAPRIRYVGGLVALAALMAAPVVTYRQTAELWTGHRSWVMAEARGILDGRAGIPVPSDGDALKAELLRRSRSVLPASERVDRVVRSVTELTGPLAVFWLLGVMLVGGRLVLELRKTNALARSGTGDPRWRDAARRMAGRMGVSNVARVRFTEGVDCPALVGWRWPAILVPHSARGLADQDMDAVLAHELAHVRRHDYLVNLLQGIAEAILFLNPAVWWISAQIREERECACDQSAIATTEAPGRYLNTLVLLESGRPPTRRAVALNAGPLLRRARRVHETARDRRTVAWSAAAAFLLAIGIAGAAVPAEGARAAARLTATSMARQDLEGMRVVLRTIALPGPAVPALSCPPRSDRRDA